MTRFWLGLLLLSGAWLCLFPVFMPEPRWVPGLALALGGTGLLVSVRPRVWRNAVWVASLVFGAQFLALQAVRPLAASHHDLRFLSPAVAGLGRGFGLPVAVDQGTVFFETEQDVLPFATNWEKLGLVMPVTLLVGLTVTVLLGGGLTRIAHVRCRRRREEASPARVSAASPPHVGAYKPSRLSAWSDLKSVACRWLGGVAVLAMYTLVRYLALCGWLIEFGDAKGLVETERLELFTGLWPTLLSHVPFALLAARLQLAGPGTPAFDRLWAGPLPWPKPIAIATIGGAVFLGLVAANVCWPGPAKAGRILVDDAHSGFWEPATPPLDTNGFGSAHLYNCSSLVEWLQHFYQVEVNTDRPINEELLRAVDVLVLKTPTRRFTAEEIAVVRAFVRRGGGLLLIGDHTNLLGMSSFLNEIAAPFGIRFRYDGSNAYSSGYFSWFRPPWLFAHPIVEGVPPVRFLTSCTLEHSPGVERVMISHDVMSDPIDYSKPSFFGKLLPNPRNGFGLFPLAVARRHGQGRVVAFAESTTLSNFAAFQDGTAPFILRTLTYLNQTNRDGAAWRWMAGVAALLLFAWAVWQLARGSAAALVLALVPGGLAGYLGAGLALKGFHRWAFPAPPPRPLEEVAYFAGGPFNYHIPPAIGPWFRPEEYSFDGLFVMPQRFGAFPRLVPIPDLPAGRFRAAVAINPTDAVPAKDLRRLGEYVSAGGRLLVFQEPGRGERFLTNLLNHCHAHQRLFARQFTVPPLFTNAAAAANPVSPVHSSAMPPGALKAFSPQQLSWSAWSVASGAVHVVSDSSLFSRAWLGNVMGEPTEPQRRVYAIAFEVFGQVLGAIDRPAQKSEAGARR